MVSAYRLFARPDFIFGLWGSYAHTSKCAHYVNYISLLTLTVSYSVLDVYAEVNILTKSALLTDI